MTNILNYLPSVLTVWGFLFWGSLAYAVSFIVPLIFMPIFKDFLKNLDRRYNKQ